MHSSPWPVYGYQNEALLTDESSNHRRWCYVNTPQSQLNSPASSFSKNAFPNRWACS